MFIILSNYYTICFFFLPQVPTGSNPVRTRTEPTSEPNRGSTEVQVRVRRTQRKVDRFGFRFSKIFPNRTRTELQQL